MLVRLIIIVIVLIGLPIEGKTLSPVKLGEDGSSYTVTQSPLLDNLVTSREQSNYTNDNNNTKSLQINLKVVQVPKRYFENALVLMETVCSDSMLLGVEIVVDTDSQKNVTVFRKIKKCYGKSEGMIISHKIGLRLPRYISYKPGFLNKYSVYTYNGFLRFWLLDRETYSQTFNEKTNKYFEKSIVHYSTNLQINEPFDRPHRPRRQCLTWFHDLISKLPYSQTCPFEAEVVTAVDFPVALSGFNTGVHRVYAPFNNPALRKQQIEAITKPRFAFAIWLYVDEYCPLGSKDCNVLHHITWNDNFATPQLQINKQGQIVVELIMEDGSSSFHMTSSHHIIPKHTWTMLLLSCRINQCNISASHGKDWQVQWTETMNTSNSSDFYFDETVGLLVYGGSELGHSFRGYIGKALFYRTKNIQAQNVPKMDTESVMYKLGLNSREFKCYKFNEQFSAFIRKIVQRIETSNLQKTCKAKENPLLTSSSSSSSLSSSSSSSSSFYRNTCPTYEFPKLTHYDLVQSIIRRYLHNGIFFYREDVADDLYRHAESLLDSKGIRSINFIISLLKQSSCLGNHDATFMLSAILNYGFTIRSQETLSHSYLMYGALSGNRLCMLSLGNKHIYGLDGFPVDYEQAYVYMKSVADMTNRDLEIHNRNDVYTEMIRLTDDFQVKEQTEEDGDVISWYKLQAGQGDFYSQQTLARMYYWGSGGLARNVEMAVEYYRLAAQSNYPSALYNYGIILLKGHGTKKNVTRALEVLKKSADQGYPQALNTLGWYSMDVERNYTKAADFFLKSHNLGNKDASYNIAYMYTSGKFPNSTVDKVKAWDYLAAGALRGQYEAGIMVGMYNMRGHPSIIRNLQLAIGWTRYVAEQNPGIGRLLSKGVKAYKSHNWYSALVYYLMAATTGVEVGNFNLAYLCDEDNGGYVKYMEKECKWRHYNLSIQRAPKDVDPYAWNKMAHYYYYHGKKGRVDKQAAIRMYVNAALAGNPQALYSLALLTDEGVSINEYFLNELYVPVSLQRDKLMLTVHLLMRCQDSYNSEAYIPCTFALYRVVFTHYWNIFIANFKIITMLFILAVTAILSLNYVHRRQIGPYNNVVGT